MDYTKIFNDYETAQGIPFYFLSKSITFPQDNSLQIYEFVNVDEDCAWTIVSYKIYGTIQYWWLLSALNPRMKFYASRGSIIKIIKPQLINDVIRYI